jgi:hypothetical protein
MADSKWIKAARLKEGSFTEQANRAHETPSQFTSDVLASKGEHTATTEKRAQLVKTFAKMRAQRG